MNILLLGNTGQLGWEMQRALQPLGKVLVLDLPLLNMADSLSIRKAVRENPAEVIVNTTAYTEVDKAESEPIMAEAVNGLGPGILAQEAARLGAFLVHFSTDYVFDGMSAKPYTEEDTPSPVNVYGLTKLKGEQAIQKACPASLVLRTSWLYSLRQGGFVKKVLDWSRSQEKMRIVSDQVGSPTWCRVLAGMVAVLLAGGVDILRERAGLYHLAGSGYTSRYDWARLILDLDARKGDQTVKEIIPAVTSDFPTPARRPLFTGLDCSKFQSTFGRQLPDWKEALHLAMS
jgi:dTDP-4-dehydrorhamnose reductase